MHLKKDNALIMFILWLNKKKIKYLLILLLCINIKIIEQFLPCLLKKYHLRFCLFFYLLMGLVYAVGIDAPGWQTPGGTFLIQSFTNISGACPMSGPDNTFLKWFDADYKKIWYYSTASWTPLAFSPTSPVSYPSTQPSWELPQGKFGTYFNNFRWTCSSTDVIKGFTTQGQKICTNTSVPSLALKELLV